MESIRMNTTNNTAGDDEDHTNGGEEHDATAEENKNPHTAKDNEKENSESGNETVDEETAAAAAAFCSFFRNSTDFWQAKCNELGALAVQMNPSQSLTVMADIFQKSIVLAKLPYVIRETKLAENLEGALEELQKNIAASPSNEELNMPEPNDPSRLDTALNDLNRLLRDIADNNDGSRLETEIGELNRLGFALNELSRRSAEQDKNPIYDSPESLPGWESCPLSIKLFWVKNRAEKLKSEARVMKERAEKLKSEARAMKSEAEKNAQTHLYKLTEHVRRIASSMGVAHQALKAMSGLCQAEGTLDTLGSDTKAAIEASAMNRKRKLERLGRETVVETLYRAPTTLSDDYMPILENAVLLEGQEETPLPLWNSMQSISNPNGTLKGIADAMSYYYEHATFLPTPETEDEENNHRIYVVSSLDELKKVLDYVGGPV
eukprot:scaffold930_cov81-Cylindrotheca_fusiformis.AAC.1